MNIFKLYHIFNKFSVNYTLWCKQIILFLDSSISGELNSVPIICILSCDWEAISVAISTTSWSWLCITCVLGYDIYVWKFILLEYQQGRMVVAFKRVSSLLRYIVRKMVFLHFFRHFFWFFSLQEPSSDFSKYLNKKIAELVQLFLSFALSNSFSNLFFIYMDKFKIYGTISNIILLTNIAW